MAETPTTPEVMDPTSTTKKPDYDVDGIVTLTYVKDKASGLPTAAKLAHLLALIISGVIALFVSAVLADGRSIMVLKDVKDLPRITEAWLVDKGLDYRTDELLGPTYGVGLHHDQSGYTWTEAGAGATLQTYIDELGLYQVIAAVPSVIATDGLKHPVEFLSCHELKSTGLSAMVLGYIAEVAAAFMIIFHGAVLVGLYHKPKIAKALAGLVWFVLTAGFMIVICLALAVMEVEWTCNNDFIRSVTLSHHFEWNYGITFAYLGFASSLLVFTTICLFTSTKDGLEKEPAPGKGTVTKFLGGITAGLVVCMVLSLAVAGGEGAFGDDDGFEDPNGDINYCAGQKPYHAGPGDSYFHADKRDQGDNGNVDCMKNGIAQVLEQAGANVTLGFKGGMDAGTWRTPIDKPYVETDLCPVNVHWHLGAEHLSVGQFDREDDASGPKDDHHRELAKSDAKSDAYVKQRRGYRCNLYDAADKRFDDSTYTWKYCTHMQVGETYEVHWPHSAAGACGTKWQYQSPFYDGVFCRDGIINILTPLNTYEKIGVQSQVFTVVNDESFYNDQLFHGMLVSDTWGHGQDIALYTGSTTGTTRDASTTCSRYAPITWQVDRKCHLISASSFDEMCRVMLEQADDMKTDIHPHGARELVNDHLVADNQASLE